VASTELQAIVVVGQRLRIVRERSRWLVGPSGHSKTQGYIECDGLAQKRVVKLISQCEF